MGSFSRRMGSRRAWCIGVCVLVVLIHLPEDTAALDTPVCGDHDESCHKLSEIVSEQARQLEQKDQQLQDQLEQKDQQLRDKDQQLQEHHRTMEGTISAQSHSLELAQLALDEHKRRHRRKLKQMRRKLKKHLVNQGRKSSSQLGEASGTPSGVESAVEEALEAASLDGTASSTTTTSMDSDPGAAARCSNVRANTTTPGDLDCVPVQDRCRTRDAGHIGDKKWEWKCQEYWSGGTCTSTSGWSEDECREKCSDASDCHSKCASKCGAGCNCNGDAIVDAVECPDGGIGWQGVFWFQNDKGSCVAWDSNAARLGMQMCTSDRKTCTKLAARHLYRMSKSAGVLMMKRIKCDEKGCAVFKAGKCFDVGQDVFSSKSNIRMVDMGDETQEWASLVVAQLKAGTTSECGRGDQKIATAGILGY